MKKSVGRKTNVMLLNRDDGLKEVENRNFCRSNYRVNSTKVRKRSDEMVSKATREGITGRRNRKQTFGFIERGIVSQKQLQIFDTRCSFLAKQKQKSHRLPPCFPSILSSPPRRGPNFLRCVIQRHSIFILGKNTENNNRETVPFSIRIRLSTLDIYILFKKYTFLIDKQTLRNEFDFSISSYVDSIHRILLCWLLNI